MPAWLKWRAMAQALRPDPIQGGGTDTTGRTIPWRMVQATMDARGVPGMAPELLAFLETAGLEDDIAREFAQREPELGALYAAWFRHRATQPGGYVSTHDKRAWAQAHGMSLSTFYRRMADAERFVIDAVGARLKADIKKRQERDGSA